jgi:hypothetical protein
MEIEEGGSGIDFRRGENEHIYQISSCDGNLGFSWKSDH